MKVIKAPEIPHREHPAWGLTAHSAPHIRAIMMILIPTQLASEEQEERTEGKQKGQRKAAQRRQRALAQAVRELETMVPPPSSKGSNLDLLGSCGNMNQALVIML